METASNQSNHVVLTEKAAKIIQEAFTAEQVDPEKALLRVGAKPGGCSGYKFEMDYADASEVGAQDLIFTTHGVRVVVDDTVLNTIMGSVEIDYQTGNMVEQGFKFKRLVDGAACGCGESFAPIASGSSEK